MKPIDECVYERKTSRSQPPPHQCPLVGLVGHGSEDRNPHLNRKSTSVARPARRHFPLSYILEVRRSSVCVCVCVCVCVWGGGARHWTTRVNNQQLWRSIVSEVLWLFISVSWQRWRCWLMGGGLLLRQSMTCSLFVRLVVYADIGWLSTFRSQERWHWLSPHGFYGLRG